MELLSLRAFDAVYQDVVAGVLRAWTPAMQEELIVHCRGWGSGGFDLELYLRSSSIRFHTAYRSACAGASTICDIGGFWGVFPITLRRLGLAATMTESLRYYGDTFDGLFGHIADCGVPIVDYDPFVEPPASRACFDAVTVMGGIERHPHVLRWFMENVTSLLGPGGTIYIEAPNASYLPERIARFLGRVSMGSVRSSTASLVDGYHAFTIDELRELAGRSGLTVIDERFYNYSRSAPSGGMGLLRRLETPLFALLKESRECVGIACRQNRLLRELRREEEERLYRRRVADGMASSHDAAILVGVR